MRGVDVDRAIRNLDAEGRADVRIDQAYLAAMSAIRWDQEIGAWYHALCARGKAPQSAVCAVAHKLLRRLMGRLRDARAAQPVPLPLAA